jgi:hypothetical protein
MNEFINCVFTTHGLAYATGLVIFLITLWLAAKRYIGLGVTFIFLLFALIAAQSISNQEALKQYFNNLLSSSPSTSYKADNTNSNEKVDINAKLQKAYDDLKDEFMLEKQKWEKLYQDLSQQKNKEAPAKPSDKNAKGNK